MLIENIPISDIKPYEHNAKKHPVEQVEHIANSIKAFGFKQPLVVDKDNVLVIGHGRLLAAQVLGLDTVPCVRADDLTPEQIKALRLADNKTNESAWDFDLLDTELAELDGLFDMTDFGFEIQAPFADELERVVEDDVPEQAEPRCKTGDIWQLGEHRLMCGDSTDAESVAKLMDGAKADMVLTDPPYNVAVGDKNQHLNAFDKGGRHTKNISNDKWATDEECGELLWKPAFCNMRENAKEQCSIYCFMPQGGAHMMMMMMAGAYWQVKHELVWVKNNHVLGFADYDYKHEPILYGWNKTHKFYSPQHEVSVFEDEVQDFSKMKKEQLVKMLRLLFEEKAPTSVIHEDKPNKSDLHPTMKPVRLLARLIRNSSLSEEIVLDLFGGSGSTLIACEQLNRKCYMMELDPHYCDVIIQRWENFTGRKAELVTED